MAEHFVSTVYNIIKVPIEKIQANSYNMNKMASPELQLLITSILADSYTQPVTSTS